jgi:hypothetical protein
MSGNDVTAIALGAVAFVVAAEHVVLLAFWGLFWKKGWRVMTPTAKPGTQAAAVPAAESEAPAGTAVPATANGAAG